MMIQFMNKIIFIFVVFGGIFTSVFADSTTLSLQDALTRVMNNNPLVKIEKINTEHLNPSGGRRDKYKPGYEPRVEICNVHGTGFILKVRD